VPVTVGPHPRLFISGERLRRLRETSAFEPLQRAAETVRRDARREVRLRPLEYPRGGHNDYLIRGRRMQYRIVTLLTEWLRTGVERYRTAAVCSVEEMGAWDGWSWITKRRGDTDPDSIFDLSYGENCATIAMAYDLLHDSLDPAERDTFRRIARTWGLRPGLIHCRPGKSFWCGKEDSNWNTVCAGGLGMLALAMYDELEEAPEALPLCEASIEPFVKLLDRTDGGWPEGIGYWNYGMLYLFMYLLSHEAATGSKHPLMRVKGLKKTLSFPLDFSPNSVPGSFGDVGRYALNPLQYAMAIRLNRPDVRAQMDRRIQAETIRFGDRPTPAYWLAVHPGTPQQPPKEKDQAPAARLYKGLDWGVLCDDAVTPSLALTVRGGEASGPHGHLDLLSFNCIVDDEKLLLNGAPAGYLDSTFSPRRHDLFEIRPESKNTIFVNGVGIEPETALKKTEVLEVGGRKGIRMDATGCFGMMRERTACTFCGRLFLVLGPHAALVVDRIELPYPGRAENRVQCSGEVKTMKSAALVRGDRRMLRISYAADVPPVLTSGVPLMTNPAAFAPTMLRWGSLERTHTTFTFATLLTPGRVAASVKLQADGSAICVSCAGREWTEEIRLTKRLKASRVR
jgi:hypothetical protein